MCGRVSCNLAGEGCRVHSHQTKVACVAVLILQARPACDTNCAAPSSDIMRRGSSPTAGHPVRSLSRALPRRTPSPPCWRRRLPSLHWARWRRRHQRLRWLGGLHVDSGTPPHLATSIEERSADLKNLMGPLRTCMARRLSRTPMFGDLTPRVVKSMCSFSERIILQLPIITGCRRTLPQPFWCKAKTSPSC